MTCQERVQVRSMAVCYGCRFYFVCDPHPTVLYDVHATVSLQCQLTLQARHRTRGDPHFRLGMFCMAQDLT